MINVGVDGGARIALGEKYKYQRESGRNFF